MGVSEYALAKAFKKSGFLPHSNAFFSQYDFLADRKDFLLPNDPTKVAIIGVNSKAGIIPVLVIGADYAKSPIQVPKLSIPAGMGYFSSSSDIELSRRPQSLIFDSDTSILYLSEYWSKELLEQGWQLKQDLKSDWAIRIEFFKDEWVILLSISKDADGFISSDMADNLNIKKRAKLLALGSINE